MIEFFRANLGLAIVGGIFCFSLLLLSGIALLMRRAGLSLKPLGWFAGFMALVLLPQLIGHSLNAYMTQPATAPANKTASASLAAAGEIDYRNPQKLFGAKAAGVIAIDGRATASGILHPADQPKYYVLPGGETLLIGRFASPADARNAIERFLAEARLRDHGRSDGDGGFSAQRGANDIVYARAYGDLFTVWSGPSPAAISELQALAGFTGAANNVKLNQSADQPDWLNTSLTRVISTASGLAVILVSLGGYLLIVVGYFFKGIAWATRETPAANSQAANAAALRAKLLAVNDLDVPFKIEAGADDRQLIADWRYADAKWIDHARAHGLRRLHRIVLTFDEPAKKVRATDYQTAYDWSAGGAGAQLHWHFQSGVVFFQYEHQRVFGLQLDDQGQFKPELSYAYTFNLQEMKAPIKRAVIQSGWSWQPLAWNGPAWLKWLTE